MSKRRSTEPPATSSGSKPEGRAVAAAGTVEDASRFLIERGFYGLVWLDAGLLVTGTKGRLVDFVKVGEPVSASVIALFGLEHCIKALQRAPHTSLEMQNVAEIGPAGPGLRLSYYLHWMPAPSLYLLIVARTTSQEELEDELDHHVRARLIAEAEKVEQARLIEKANAELTRANRELAEFAYVISHDLKSPLRALRYQAEDVQHALQVGDSETALARLESVKMQTRRMSRMLSDLLAYARIGRETDAIEWVDLREMVEAIVASLPRPIGFTIALSGEWPAIETLAAPLDLVLRNLIDNAIKHHDRADGRIEIKVSVAEQGIDISVADDGPGIPAKHHHAVFQPFRRLGEETGATTEGSGIGLALVRKAADVAGAAIELVSDPPARRGTEFRLRWPAKIVS